MKKYFKKGEQVKLKEKSFFRDEGDIIFDVKILDLVCDHGGDEQMYYVVEPVDFKGVPRTVPCEHCYKE